MKLHGAQVSIILEQGMKLSSYFWHEFQKVFVTYLNLSTTLHPQKDGQTEKTTKTLEDMIRACMIDFMGSWVCNLPRTDFA